MRKPTIPHTLTKPSELAAILDSIDLADASGASLYVELGVRHGGTSYRIKKRLQNLRRKAHLLCVDCDKRAQGRWITVMEKPEHGARVTWSFELATTQDAAAKDRAGPCAWVFVDACHCFECATDDIEQWGAKIAPGGILAVHDTTDRRKHYTKNFQHGGTRPFGSWQAVEKAEESGILSRGWRKLWDVEDQNGVRVYQKE